MVFVIPADGGTPRQITSGDFNHSGPLSWSPDGNRIALTGNREDDWEFNPENTELWSVDVANGDMQRLTERFGPDEKATYSPDGSKIAFIGFDDKKMGYHNWNVYVMDVGRVDPGTDDGFRSIGRRRQLGGQFEQALHSVRRFRQAPYRDAVHERGHRVDCRRC